MPVPSVEIGRVYDFQKKMPAVHVILVDRLWPRGRKKEDLPIDLWAKDWAPSSGLRKRFHQGEVPFLEFRQLYVEELEPKKGDILSTLRQIPEKKVLLLFSAKNTDENNATVLLDAITRWRGESQTPD